MTSGRREQQFTGRKSGQLPIGNMTHGRLLTAGSHKVKVQTAGGRCRPLGQAKVGLGKDPASLRLGRIKTLRGNSGLVPAPTRKTISPSISWVKSGAKRTLSAAWPRGSCSLAGGRTRRVFYKTVAEENTVRIGFQNDPHAHTL